MRIVRGESGEQYNIRGLLRKEVKYIRDEHVIDLGRLTADNAEWAMDLVLERVLTEHEFKEIDDRPYKLGLEIFKAALSETYGNEDEEKN